MTGAGATGPEQSPVVVIGSGVAGLSVAWALSPQPVLLITAGALTEFAASTWAQGGVAAAVGPDDDVALHALDTFRAGAEAGDLRTIERITAAAPGVLDALVSIGARFDRDSTGGLDLALEGGHCRHRVAHVGDHSGAAVTAAVAAHVRTLPGVEIWEQTTATALLLDDDGAVRGLQVNRHGSRVDLATERVVIATGGMGGLFRHTTNPLTALGSGVVLGARAGARVEDLHLVQFHPTALDVGRDPMPLLTEALRGAGAVLVADGDRFTDELAPRDVVSAAVWAQLDAGRAVMLDARDVPEVATRFPRVAELVAECGLSLAEDLLPVRPAMHYAMGGLWVDSRSRTTVPGLWAVGEAARTGLHGANRLASNSLLEAVVTGWAAGQDATTAGSNPRSHGAAAAVREQVPAPAPDRAGTVDPIVLERVRTILGQSCGVLRDGETLRHAVAELAQWRDDDAGYLGWLIARSALDHPHSIGAHRRTDSVPAGLTREAVPA